MKIASPSDALARSNVHLSGTGSQAIVLLHGLGGNQCMWQPLLPALEKRYRVVMLDLVGCGNSDVTAYSTERHGTLAGHAHDLLDVLRTLDLHHVIFMGHSVGSIIGMLAAIEEPSRFTSMVLIAPSPRFLNSTDYHGGYERSDVEELLAAMESDFMGWTEAFVPAVVGVTNRPDLLMAFTNSFVQSNPAVVRHLTRVVFMADVRDDLPRLTIPTLIVQSAHDAITPLAVGHYLHNHLVDSHFSIIDTTGHCPHLTAPEQTMAAVDKFLSYQAAQNSSQFQPRVGTSQFKAAS
ncbi:alpha/beta fold hydrolase [Hymenobacter negativus]|uniref:Alpha/beta hydrolase n=1 Tax=Hymenobacter negativus TaxID=2795026 RepID=A0ABS3QHD2_9BACT|nr:alpha/beta hydrolase [Hymenobacter negativus]MBO2010646.1 alpha/beta hydrolase [Hymenobacter negativus]